MKFIKRSFMLMTMLIFLIVMSLQVQASGCKHVWGEWEGEYGNEPTCTKEGTMVRECLLCSKEQTKSVPALGHKWDQWEYEDGKEPTCTKKGTKTRMCEECLEEQTKSVPALGHKWGKWGYDYDNEPTCTKKGTMTRNCQRLDCEKIQTKKTPALGHKWGKWQYDYSEDKPTCTKKGIMFRECQRDVCCEVQAKSVSALGHKWGKWHVDAEPTVLNAGKKSRICVRCKKGETHAINKLKGVYGKSSTINTYPEKKLNVSNIGLKGKKKYTSSNKKIATVNSRGIIQTKKAGKCKITVKSGKQSYKINLVVNKPVLDFESFIDDYDTRNNVFYVVITNNGTNNLKVTSGIKVEEVDYKSYDRKISTKAVTIKPGAEKTIKFKVKGKVTWYDYEDFTLYYKIKYDGKTYTVGTDAEDSWLCKK